MSNLAFWAFMLIACLAIPTVMIIIGYNYMNTPKQLGNGHSGYRTALSMKNQETWAFAQMYSGKAYFRCGLILFPISLLAMILVLFLKNSISVISAFGGINTGISIIVLIVCAVKTERALQTCFDDAGNRRNKMP